MKKIFQRTCMGCNIKKDKKDLLRVALNKNGDICVDKTNKADGRGFYICNNIKCLENMVKTKRLNRMLKKNINNDIYEDLRGVIIGKSGKIRNRH